jgi:hypothetical protein
LRSSPWVEQYMAFLLKIQVTAREKPTRS